MPTYDYKCMNCKSETQLTQVPADFVPVCACGEGMVKVFLPGAIKIKTKTASATEKGIKRDLIEMSHLEEARDGLGPKSRDERYRINSEIQKNSNK